MTKRVTLTRVATNEQNISKQTIWYDVYVDGKYHSTHDDQCDALDLIDEIREELGED